MRNSIRAAILAAVAMPLAQAAYANEAYWTNKEGKIITSERTRLCIRTVRWTEQKADRACLDKAKKQMMSMRK